ncbi:ankyrin repeat domain-containing protein [Actinoplanes awajinensis]|uniref:Uncharacterized protein n=1 Tax=Actinoplanes awajinensis subsp. mycoplanecinus TaxID=135947 RepID=A0A117MLM5_9ACTN|nr:ankyrin repeat domain-containing protein [Actinoplanes awajinensis]KUL24172.1 hypothetical protein ADL15_44005 [Actinoplanes awajinensis subsp. mycoplanecinus]
MSLAEWERIRRYAVPARMITECTAARERGDWAAACAAGDVDVTFDAASLAERFGPDGAATLLGMLAGFAPDLLRWHLPRALGGYSTLATDVLYLLAPDGPVDLETVLLTVRSPQSVLGSQRLTLGTGRLADLLPVDAEHLPVPPIRLAPHHWDARRAGELRATVSGPALTAAGVEGPRTPTDLLEAWHAAGLPISHEEAVRLFTDDHFRLIDPYALVAEARRVAAQFGERTLTLTGWLDRRQILRLGVDGDVVTATAQQVTWDGYTEVRRLPHLSPRLLRFPPDLDLVRHGRLPAGALHPLIRSALFPGTPAAPPAEPADRAVFTRVRCHGEWHVIDHRDGRLHLPAHTAAEAQRERALRAFGGPVSGCFAAAQAWTGMSGRLPKRLRDHRRDLWLRMVHGGTRVVLELLDGGMDPGVRDGRGRTLLHRLRSFDHTRLLPRLLEAGLNVNDRDKEGSTPLYLAVVNLWPPELIIALVDAGADPRMPNQDDVSVLDYLDDMLAYLEPKDQRGPAFHAAVEYLKEHA